MTENSDNTRRYFTKDYKKIRILNFIYDNRSNQPFSTYTLLNLVSLTTQNYKYGPQAIEELEVAGLLRKKDEPKSDSYFITEKGVEFITDLRSVKHMESCNIELFKALKEPTKPKWHVDSSI